MSGCVDQVELVILSIFGVVDHPYSRCFNRHALFAFQVHCIQYLRGHIAVRDRVGHLQHAVCQGRFSVIHMRDNTKIPYSIHKPLSITYYTF